MYSIRLALKGDLPHILSIYARARAFMARTGNPNQWGDHHPPVSQVEQDIALGQLYVVLQDARICGVFYFSLDDDPTYALIFGGQWHCDAPYGTIHRIASDGSGGIFAAVLDHCLAKCGYLRIDTHEDNKVMQHVLEKHGFRRCGIIYLANGSPRIAYDRM